MAGDGPNDAAPAAGADGGEVGVAAAVPGVDFVNAHTVAGQCLAARDQLALHVALLADLQGFAAQVVDEAAVVGWLVVVGDGCQVAVDIVPAAAGAEGLFLRADPADRF